MDKLETNVCINCICLPICLSKNQYMLLDDCGILKNSVYNLTKSIKRHYTQDNYQIGLDLVNISGVDRQIVVETHLNRRGVPEIWARAIYDDPAQSRKVRLDNF